MRVGSLFSGIGGLELGLSWAFDAAGVDHEVAWQVELNPFCRQVLAQHWPNAERFEDVKDCSLSPVDLICGGFPCQDISGAGSGKGLAGSRSGLWYEFARIVGELRPTWVVVENVTSGAKRWVDAVRAGLADLGYETLPVPLSAASVGAPHLRRRIFIVAHANGGGCESLRQSTVPGVEGQAGGQPDGRGGAQPDDQRDARTPAPDASGEGLQGTHAAPGSVPRQGAPGCAWAEGAHPEPTLRPVDDGVPPVMVRRRGTSRRQCLVALGNSVVPQCAEVVGWVIVELMRRSHAA